MTTIQLTTITTVMAAIAPVLTLAGVWLGSRLTARNTSSNWLRDQRQAAYIDFIDAFVALDRHFAIELRRFKFEPEELRDDEEQLRDTWWQLENRTDHAGERVQLLGGERVCAQARVAEGFAFMMNRLWCLEGVVDEDEWEALSVMNHVATRDLRRAMRQELLGRRERILDRALRPRRGMAAYKRVGANALRSIQDVPPSLEEDQAERLRHRTPTPPPGDNQGANTVS